MPSSLVGVLVALGIFVPGYLAVRVRYLVGPPETPRSDFTLTLECLLLGFANGLLVAFIAIPFAWSLVRTHPGLAPVDAGKALAAWLVADPTPWLWLPLFVLVPTILFPLIVGIVVGMAYRSKWYGTRIARLRTRKVQATAWDAIFVREHQRYVWVFAKDGEILEGRVIHANTHPEPPALWLADVKYWDKDEDEWKDCTDQHLYVSGDNIHYLLVDESQRQETAPHPSSRQEESISPQVRESEQPGAEG